jgi:hypothetical protein
MITPNGYIIQVYRAFGASTVTFGPFATREEAFDWLNERKLTASVIGLADPALDTKAGAEIWCG